MNRKIKETINKDQLREQEHNYELYETDNGFMVSPIEKERPLVFASLTTDGYWHVSGNNDNYKVMMYDFFRLSAGILDTLYDTWKSPVFNPNPNGQYEHQDEEDEKSRPEYFKKVNKYTFIRDWAKLTTKKTLAKKMRDMWKKKNDEIVSEETRTLHSKVFSTSSGKGNVSTLGTILGDREQYGYLIKDLINYRGARALMLELYEETFLSGDWKTAFGDMSNGSMRKTLMNFPGVPYFFAGTFAYNKRVLPEPALTRIRFMAYAVLSRSYDYRWAEMSKVILRSSDSDVKKAVRMVWEYYENIPKGGFRNTRFTQSGFEFVYSYPDKIGDWDIVGLCKRSVVWHKGLENQRRETEVAMLKKYNATLEEKTALPPIVLPDTPGVTFLDTCKAVIDEGFRMGHCISGYANDALKGNCYLFHVDYEGEMASVEVAPGGFVRQSQGLKNKQNKASVYGQKLLNKWAHKFPANSLMY